jgi:mannose-1-phosphate guanylyltransferase
MKRTGTGPQATIGLHPVEDSSAFGLVRAAEGGEVLEFLEKTGDAVPGEVNAGMYVLERSVLGLIPPGRECSIEREVFPRLVGQGLFATTLDGYWVDIGTPERYLAASWDILEGRVETRVEPTGPGVLIDPTAAVDPAAAVGPRAVLGPGCRIAAGATVARSVLLAGSAVGEGARVEGSILAAGATVAARANVRDAIAAPDEKVPA